MADEAWEKRGEEGCACEEGTGLCTADCKEPKGLARAAESGLGGILVGVACEACCADTCVEADVRRCGLLADFPASTTEEALDGPSSIEDLKLECLEVDISRRLLAYVKDNGWGKCSLRDWRMKSSMFRISEFALASDGRSCDKNSRKQC